MGELKPCPFCGGKAVLKRKGMTSYYVKCSKCKIAQSKPYQSIANAFAAWNRRACDDTD